jgi:hypothetical protein
MEDVDCDNGVEIKIFVGCKVDINWAMKTLKLTQPVILHSFTDEFKIKDEQQPSTPGIPAKALQLGNQPAAKGQ